MNSASALILSNEKENFRNSATLELYCGAFAEHTNACYIRLAWCRKIWIWQFGMHQHAEVKIQGQSAHVVLQNTAVMMLCSNVVCASVGL